eukprot:3720615-Pleurochrysis_carterae.AAC.1
MDSRAWVGINLGRSSLSPGAFNILVPGYRIVTTSDVYFDEPVFPWSRSSVGAPNAPLPPQPALPTQPPGLPADEHLRPPPHDVRSADHVLGAAASSRRVLLLFSGPFR